MKCHKARKLIPLAAGKDLPAKKAAAVGEHLKGCPDCRREASELEGALQAAKTLAGKERIEDWSEAEWRKLLGNVTAPKMERKRPWAELSFKPALAGAVGLVLLVIGSFLLLKKSGAPPVTQAALTPSVLEQVAPKELTSRPDVSSKTIVSKETGLKIIWFYNKNFQGDGYGK